MLSSYLALGAFPPEFRTLFANQFLTNYCKSGSNECLH